MIKRSIIVLSSIMFVYVVTYIINSCYGGYWMKPVSDGKDRYSFGLSMPTAIIWQPRFGYATPFQKDIFGCIFMPLIALDRYLVHPTRYLTNSKDEKWLFSNEAQKFAHPKTKL